jgi:hypothetical protein
VTTNGRARTLPCKSSLTTSQTLTFRQRCKDSSSRGSRPKAVEREEEDDEDEDEEDLDEIIRESIAKRDVKGGTEILKKTKGKTKIIKGEVGGGSFQSMGASIRLLIICPLLICYARSVRGSYTPWPCKASGYLRQSSDSLFLHSWQILHAISSKWPVQVWESLLHTSSPLPNV